MKHENDKLDVKPLYIQREDIENLIIYNIDAKEALNNDKVPQEHINMVRKTIARNNMTVMKFIEKVVFISELN